jgi:hypothetical protein
MILHVHKHLLVVALRQLTPRGTNLISQYELVITRICEKAAEAVKAEAKRQPALYWPSKMTITSRDRLIEIYMQAYDAELQRRLAFVLQRDRELHEQIPAWPMHTSEELLAIRPPTPTIGGFK